MSRLFIGCRVRLVQIRSAFHSGWRVGEEGRIVGGIDESYPHIQHEWNIELDNGALGFVTSSQIEPILPRQEPCESEFKESLDKLLSEVSRETV
jgi:hypothetical protein